MKLKEVANKISVIFRKVSIFGHNNDKTVRKIYRNSNQKKLLKANNIKEKCSHLKQLSIINTLH